MTYKEPPTKFNPGTKKFEVDLSVKESKPPIIDNLDNEARKEAFIFLIIMVLLIILGYFMIKFLT